MQGAVRRTRTVRRPQCGVPRYEETGEQPISGSRFEHIRAAFGQRAQALNPGPNLVANSRTEPELDPNLGFSLTVRGPDLGSGLNFGDTINGLNFMVVQILSAQEYIQPWNLSQSTAQLMPDAMSWESSTQKDFGIPATRLGHGSLYP